MREFLVKLQDDYEQIALNQISLIKPDLTFEQYKNSCDEILKNLKNLRLSIKNILNDDLYPMLEDIESVSVQDENDLYSVAQKLSSFETRQDAGLAFAIYRALLKRARTEKDEAKILKFLYWCGITQFFFHLHNSAIAFEYFNEGTTYAEKYHTFNDPEIRQYVHRCLGNASMSLYGINEPQKAMAREEKNFAFWNKLIFKGSDPEFPWLNYFLNGLNHRRSYLTDIVHKDPDAESQEKVNEILDVSISINKLYHKNMEYYNVFGGTRYDYHLWEAQFLSGMISFDNFIENIEKKQAEFSGDDYSHDAMYINIQMNSYIMFYASKMKKLESVKEATLARVSKKTIDYFSSIPKTVSNEHVNVFLRLLAKEISDVFTPDEQLDFILKMTTFRHIPTHAHSIMVSKTALLLTRFLIDMNPEIFIGCMGIKTKEEAIERAEELCKFAEKGGICHDIGKIGCIDNPYMHIRVLTEDEYKVIKGHPEEGMRLLSRSDNDPTNQGYIDIIKGHHRFWNNKGGYPDNTDNDKSEYKIMIDIITTANSICAATDNISKTYTDVKSLKEVCAEINADAGTVYSPAIAEILNDKTVFSSIDKLLTEENDRAYYAAYLYAWSGGKTD